MERNIQTTFLEEATENLPDLRITLRDDSHESLMEELIRQSQNRRDFYVPERTGRFVGCNFEVEGVRYPLDVISNSTLSERFKMSGNTTVTRKGLHELANEPELYAQVSNYFYNKINKPIQFRTLYGLGLAFPSKNYTIVNHLDLLNTVFETLNPIFGNEPRTMYNYLDKRIMYSFIPVPFMDDIPLRTFNGQVQSLCFGIEIRNSEILERAVVITFKLFRKDNNTGIILNREDSTFYQRHIGMTTAEALGNVRSELIGMFQNQLEDAINTIETLRTIMGTNVEDGPETARKFARVLELDQSTLDRIVELATVTGDNTVYGWTLGPLTQLAAQYRNRETQEELEREAGKILTSHELLERILA